MARESRGCRLGIFGRRRRSFARHDGNRLPAASRRPAAQGGAISGTGRHRHPCAAAHAATTAEAATAARPVDHLATATEAPGRLPPPTPSGARGCPTSRPASDRRPAHSPISAACRHHPTAVACRHRPTARPPPGACRPNAAACHPSAADGYCSTTTDALVPSPGHNSSPPAQPPP